MSNVTSYRGETRRTMRLRVAPVNHLMNPCVVMLCEAVRQDTDPGLALRDYFVNRAFKASLLSNTKLFSASSSLFLLDLTLDAVVSNIRKRDSCSVAVII